MTTTVKNVQTFLDSIGFSNYADVGKITIQGEVVTVTLAKIHNDLAQAHQHIAEKFGFEAVEVNIDSTTQYWVNVPEKGSFGFINSKDNNQFTLVIYNQKYAGTPEIKETISNFLNKVEEFLTPHIQSLREAFTIDKEQLKKETPEQKAKKDSAVEKALSPFVKSLKEKFIGLREQKNKQPLTVEHKEGSGVTFETGDNGKLVIKQNGKAVGHQG